MFDDVEWEPGPSRQILDSFKVNKAHVRSLKARPLEDQTSRASD